MRRGSCAPTHGLALSAPTGGPLIQKRSYLNYLNLSAIIVPVPLMVKTQPKRVTNFLAHQGESILCLHGRRQLYGACRGCNYNPIGVFSVQGLILLFGRIRCCHDTYRGSKWRSDGTYEEERRRRGFRWYLDGICRLLVGSVNFDLHPTLEIRA